MVYLQGSKNVFYVKDTVGLSSQLMWKMCWVDDGELELEQNRGHFLFEFGTIFFSIAILLI